MGRSSCIRESGCIWASDSNRAKWLSSGKVVVFSESCSILANMVVIGQNSSFGKKWLYLGKVVVLGRGRLSSGKVVVFGQKGCFFRAKWLSSGKVVAFGQSGCIRAKWL